MKLSPPPPQHPQLLNRRDVLAAVLAAAAPSRLLLAQTAGGDVLSQPRPGAVSAAESVTPGSGGGAPAPMGGSAPAGRPPSLKVGVLLPLSGRFGPPGQEVKRGIEVAQRILPPTDKGPLQLLYRDTQDDAAQTVQAMRTLAEQEQVVAFIGPLVSSTAEAAAQCAAALQIPLLALTQRSLAVPQSPPWVFRLMFTPKQQMAALAAFACDRLGLKRFGVMAPESRYAQELAGLFVEQLQAKGAQVLSRQSYPVGTTRFGPLIQGLEQAASAQKAGGLEPSASVNTGQKGGEGSAETVVAGPSSGSAGGGSSRKGAPVEGLFVPDTAPVVAQLAAALAWAEVPVGAFLRGGARAPLRLLGTSAWNTPQLPILGGKYLEDSLFVDLFFAGSMDASVQRFVRGWKDTHQATWPHPPEALSALGYDAFGLLHALLIEGPLPPVDLAGLFRRVAGYQGVTGTLSFDPQGEAVRTLPVLSVSSGLLVQVEPVSFGLTSESPPGHPGPPGEPREGAEARP